MFRIVAQNGTVIESGLSSFGAAQDAAESAELASGRVVKIEIYNFVTMRWLPADPHFFAGV